MKKIRKNALKSFLFICLGLTVTTIVFAGARLTVGPPDPPGKPIAVEVSTTGCLLRYEAPRNDGGSPIMCYIIEGQYDGFFSIWEDKGTSYTTEHTVSDMIEGYTAIFRVIARNKYGASKPSKESNEVTFEDPHPSK